MGAVQFHLPRSLKGQGGGASQGGGGAPHLDGLSRLRLHGDGAAFRPPVQRVPEDQRLVG